MKKARCNRKWKLQAYHAVVISQSVYGLETLCLNDTRITRLDAFRMKCIRHIVGIDHSYRSRTSNAEILTQANWLIRVEETITRNWSNFKTPHDENAKHIRLVSEVMENRKIKRHDMRCDHRDSLYVPSTCMESCT